MEAESAEGLTEDGTQKKKRKPKPRSDQLCSSDRVIIEEAYPDFKAVLCAINAFPTGYSQAQIAMESWERACEKVNPGEPVCLFTDEVRKLVSTVS